MLPPTFQKLMPWLTNYLKILQTLSRKTIQIVLMKFLSQFLNIQHLSLNKTNDNFIQNQRLILFTHLYILKMHTQELSAIFGGNVDDLVPETADKVQRDEREII